MRVLRGLGLSVRVLMVWVLHVLILHVWVLLLDLSLVCLCLSKLRPVEVFLLHLSDVLAGVSILALARSNAVKIGALAMIVAS